LNNCGQCGGTGWIIIERRGISAADRCPCSVVQKTVEEAARPTVTRITGVLARIAEADVIPFFPKTEDGWIIMAAEIANFVEDTAGLDLLARMTIRHLKKYEGVISLRQVYCAYRTPADGVYPAEALPGFRTEECEARYKLTDEMRRADRVEEYQRLAPAEERVPFLLPEAKTL
jgi:hypothetical protein